MRRRVCAPLALAAMTVAVVASSATIRAQGAAAERAAGAAAIASAALEEWFGPRPSAQPIRMAPSPFDAARSMNVESAVAFELARQWFDGVVDDPTITDGLAWYLQSRVVERAFDRIFLAPGYRFQTTCFFGCHVRWSWRPLIVGRWGDGLGRAEFTRTWSGRHWPLLDRRPAAGFDRPTLAAALAFASLERELGWPTLQGALRVAAAATGRPLIEILSDATARDLAAVFRLAGSTPTDHRLGPATTTRGTTCAAEPCYITTVPVVGGGGQPFPLTLRVDFADGAHIVAAWKGRDETFEFESPAPAVRVRLDPDRIWLLDRDYADNEYLLSASEPALSARWIAQWILWLQDAMLTHTFPV